MPTNHMPDEKTAKIVWISVAGVVCLFVGMCAYRESEYHAWKRGVLNELEPGVDSSGHVRIYPKDGQSRERIKELNRKYRYGDR